MTDQKQADEAGVIMNTLKMASDSLPEKKRTFQRGFLIAWDAATAHERQRSKLLEDAIIEATADSHTDILRRPIHNVLTKALKRYRGEE